MDLKDYKEWRPKNEIDELSHWWVEEMRSYEGAPGLTKEAILEAEDLMKQVLVKLKMCEGKE